MKRLHTKTAFTAAIAVLIVLLAAIAVLAVAIGPVPVPVEKVLAVLKDVLFRQTTPDAYSQSQYHIIWNIRMPRIVMSMISGAGLAVSGTVMQAIVRNPIADPYILGVSSGASTGAAIALLFPSAVLFHGGLSVTVMAFLGAMLASVAVYSLSFSRESRSINPTSLILAGTAVSAILSAVTNLLIFMAQNKDSISSIYYWQMGSLASSQWTDIPVPAVIVICGCGIILLYTQKMNLLMIGEEDAYALGLNIKAVRLVLMVCSSFMVASIVANTGIIGFVGLMIPHIVRLMVGSDNTKVVPLSALAGAIFLILADTVARTAFGSTELPIGIITAFTGAPFFLYLMKKKKYTFGGKR